MSLIVLVDFCKILTDPLQKREIGDKGLILDLE